MLNSNAKNFLNLLEMINIKWNYYSYIKILENHLTIRKQMSFNILKEELLTKYSLKIIYIYIYIDRERESDRERERERGIGHKINYTSGYKATTNLSKFSMKTLNKNTFLKQYLIQDFTNIFH